MTQAETREETLLNKLRDHDYRLTPQRVALINLLVNSDEHPSAAQLYESLKAQFPTTSLATVYKTLTVLKDLGEVQELGFSDDDNRYDATSSHPHPHLICVHCRKIVDADVSIAPDAERVLSERTGYQILSRRLDFYGICPACQKTR